MSKSITIQIAISGMHCANCANGLTKALSDIPGVITADVNFGTELASLSLDLQKITLKKIQLAIEQNGFSILFQKITIAVGGMHCASCAQSVRNALMEIPEIEDAVINPSTETAMISLYSQSIPFQSIQQKINSNGYSYDGVVSESGSQERELKTKKEQRIRIIRMIISFGVSIPLMIVMYIPSLHHMIDPWLMFFLTTPIFVYVALPIYSAAFISLRNRSLTMDVMYALGISAAYIASVLGAVGFLPSHEFMLYETAIMLAGFLTLGRFLEANARGKTSQAISKLINLQPKNATVIKDGKEVTIPVEKIVCGTVVIVKPGEQIPVDGTVIEGESSVDEAMISGEPLPVFKKQKHAVTAGTINKSGVLHIQAERIGKDTVLAKIISLVRDAQGSRPPIQLLADKVVAVFIPIILAIALVSFLFWYFISGSTLIFSLTTLIAVIVIACPCALGLASPTAVTVGIGRGAELGILIKKGEVLEAAENVSTIVFDKTGTLTEGKPYVVDCISYGVDKKEILCVAASLEKNSLHPLADAIVNYAEQEGCVLKKCTSFVSIEGRGVAATIGDDEILLGNEQMMRKYNVDFNLDTKDTPVVPAEYQDGMSHVIIAINKKISGIIIIADSIRKNSIRAVSELKKMGMEVVMLTGDNVDSAKKIAAKIGITNVIAGVLPDQKGDTIKQLQKAGKKVAFVGDGINDAPSLAQADIGIAMGKGSDIAIETGEIVLVKNDPLDAVASILLGRKILSRIRVNIFWAFAYNAVLIPLAAGVLQPWFHFTFKPELAGFAMALSSVTVVTFSLLLKGYTPEVLKIGNLSG